MKHRRIITASTFFGLKAKIEEWKERGWTTEGGHGLGFFTHALPGGHRYSQTMVREDS